MLIAVLLYPPVFAAVATRLLRPFGAQDVAPLPARTALALLGFYACTWPLGGLALFFLLRSVGGDPAVSSILYLGGASAIGAIVAVLAVFAPSGLGVREASVYGLLLAVATGGRRARRGRPEPARDHGRRGGAAARRRPPHPSAPDAGRGRVGAAVREPALTRLNACFRI